MRKLLYVAVPIIVIIRIFLLLFWGLTLYSIFAPVEYEGERGTLRWVREESCFVDYSILEDIIQLRYSMCFENESGHDLVIYGMGVRFDKSTLAGIMENDGFVNCKGENSHYILLIPDGDKINVIVSLEGEYLGGEINEDLAIPVEMMPIIGLAKELPSEYIDTEDSIHDDN